MEAKDADPSTPELESRDPALEDLVALCRELNAKGARYLVVGGFAMNAAGLSRHTGDVDLLIDSSLENEALVFSALATLPDKAVLELKPGDVREYGVVRIADEIVIDLMHAACGIVYSEAALDIVYRLIQSVSIPFASPRLLWRMKAPLNRDKDMGDLYFLRQLFASAGEHPPTL